MLPIYRLHYTIEFLPKGQLLLCNSVMDGLTIKSVLHECSLDQGSPSRSGMSSDGEDILDQLEAASTPKTVKAPRKPVSDRTTTTLFIRNLPFTTTSKVSLSQG